MVRLNEVRPGELAIDLPARADAEVYFIGRIRTPWTDRRDCPRQGRADGPTCRIEVFVPWDKGLDSVTEFERLEVLYWLHEFAAGPGSAKPPERRPGARGLLPAHAGEAQSRRHLDRAAGESRGAGPVRARNGLSGRHAADRPQARPHALQAAGPGTGRRLPGGRQMRRRDTLALPLRRGHARVTAAAWSPHRCQRRRRRRPRHPTAG